VNSGWERVIVNECETEGWRGGVNVKLRDAERVNVKLRDADRKELMGKGIMDIWGRVDRKRDGGSLWEKE